MACKKAHIPKGGYCSDFEGEALCGQWAHYVTADHALIVANAQAAKRHGLADHYYCARCLRGLDGRES